MKENIFAAWQCHRLRFMADSHRTISSLWSVCFDRKVGCMLLYGYVHIEANRRNICWVTLTFLCLAKKQSPFLLQRNTASASPLFCSSKNWQAKRGKLYVNGLLDCPN